MLSKKSFEGNYRNFLNLLMREKPHCLSEKRLRTAGLRAINLPNLKCLAKKHVDVTLGPTFKLGYSLEAGLFIHCRRLEIITCDPNPTDTSIACLRDESIQ